MSHMDFTVTIELKVKQGKQKIQNIQKNVGHIHPQMVHILAMDSGGCVRKVLILMLLHI